MSTRAREIAELGQKLTVDASGNLDIAGSGTFDGLTVDGDATIGQTSGGDRTLSIGSAGAFHFDIDTVGSTGRVYLNATNDSTAGKIHLQTAGADRLFINNNGDISVYRDDGSTIHTVFDASNGFTDHRGTIKISSNQNDPNDSTASYITNKSGWGPTIHGYRFRVNAGLTGSHHNVFAVGSNLGAVFNEDSRDYDFRVESDNNSHMLVVDASANSVGIGYAGPTAAGLEIRTDVNNTYSDTIPYQTFTGDSLVIYNNPASSSDDYVSINMLARGAQTSAMRHIVTTPSGGDTDYIWQFRDSADTSNTVKRMIYTSDGSQRYYPLTGTTTVFNEDGVDHDFRVEGSSGSNLLFCDAGNQSVNIHSNANTGYRLNIEGGIQMGLVNDVPDSNGYSFIGATDGGTGGIRSGEGNHIIIAARSTAPRDIIMTTRDNGGISRQRLTVYGNDEQLVINEDSRDYDFRVESNNNTHMLFVNAGDDRVGIGTNSPAQKLTVNSAVLNGNTYTGVANTAYTSYGSTPAVSFMLGANNETSVANNRTYQWNMRPAQGGSQGHFLTFQTKQRLETTWENRVAFGPDGGIFFNGDTAAANGLDDYEQGTWNVQERNGQAPLTTNRAHYTKIGNMVYAAASVSVGSTTNNNHLNFTLPFSSSINGFYLGGGNVSYHTLLAAQADNLRPNIENAAHNVFFFYNQNDKVTCAQASGRRIDFFVIYHTHA